MGRKHVHAAVTAGLAIALATGGVPTAAVAESLGIEPAPANESAAVPQGTEALGSSDGASPSAADAASEGAAGGDVSDSPDQPAAAPAGTAPAVAPDNAVPGFPSGEDAPADPDSAGTEQPQANDFEIVSNTYMTRWVDPGETIDVALPRELQVRYQDNSTEMVPVTWTHQTWGMDIPVIEIVDGVAKSVPAGYHHFEADVMGRTVDFGLDVTERSAGDTQESISSIRPIVVTAYTTEYAGPSNELSLGGVEATMANGEQQWLEVAWDAIPRELYDGDEDAGEFTVHGVIERYGNYPVEAKVVVAVPRAQGWTENVAVPAGQVPEMPESVQIEFSNGSNMSVPVSWAMPGPDAFAHAGVVYVKGSIPQSKLSVQIKVKVEEVVAITSTFEHHALVGNPLDYEHNYYQASVTFADGTYGSVPVIWDPIDDALYDTAGTYEVKGRLKGYGNEVTLKLVVHDAVLNPVIEKRLTVGASPISPTTSESFELSEGQTRFYEVDWNRAQIDAIDFAQAGEHLIDGVIQNTNIAVQMKLGIVDIDRVVVSDTVKTLVGVRPQLPQYAKIVYTDGVVKSEWVSWNEILPSQYAAEGTFDATGEVYLENAPAQKVTCPVVVLRAQAPASVDAVTLVGRSPQLPQRVKVTMWDGTVVYAKAQWENADPQDFGKPGSFDVHGYLLGSNIEIVAHVQAMGLKDDLVCEVGYYPGAPAKIENYNRSLELENGDQVNIDSVEWDPFPRELLDGIAGTYEVGGTIAESPVRVRALVTTGRIGEIWGLGMVAVPAGGELVLPTTVSGALESGQAVYGLPVTWDEYDANPQEDMTVTGHVAGYDKPVSIEVRVVHDPKFVFQPIYAKRGHDASAFLPTEGRVRVEVEDGWIEDGKSCSVAWDTSAVDWSKSGTISGVAHATEIGYAEDVPVTIAHEALDELNVVDGLEVWTEPGVEPELNNVVIELAPGHTHHPWVEWEGVDPSLYSKAGSTFKVKGHINDLGFDVEATVHVAEVTRIDVPEYVSTSSGVYPSLPYEVPVHWSDGATTMEYASWDNISGSVYTGEAGKTTTVYGAIRNSFGELVHQLSAKVVIVAPAAAFDNGELDIATQEGVRPLLPNLVAARMSDDTVSYAAIAWDPVPAEKYAEPGTFEATGRIEGYAAGAVRMLRMGSGEINVAPDGSVTATITVRPESEKPVYNQPQPHIVSAVVGSDLTRALPDEVGLFDSKTGGLLDMSHATVRAVTWDLSGIDADTPGSYRITGTIDGVEDVEAVAYVNVTPKPRAVKSVEPLELTVTKGASPEEVDAQLLRKVAVSYDDGTTGVADVEAWDMTPITADSLGSEGDIELSGRLVGSKVAARAVVHVVADPAEVPVEVAPLEAIEVREGSKLSALIKKLPARVAVVMKDGSTKDFDVTWDAPHALGKEGSEQVVSGMTSCGLAVELRVVVTGRVPVQSIAVSGEGVADGRVVLKKGDTLKLKFSVEPEGASSSVAWASSDAAVVTVDANGVLSAQGAGEAVVTVSSTANPEVKTELKVVVEGDPEPVPDPEPGPQPDPDPEPTPDPEPEPEPEPEPDPDPEPTPDPDPTPEPKPDPDPELTPDPDPTPEPEPDPDPAPKPDPEPEPTPDPEPTPTPNPDPAPKPKPGGGESAAGSATAKPQLPATGDPAAMAAAVGSTGLAALAAAFLDRMRRRK